MRVCARSAIGVSRELRSLIRRSSQSRMETVAQLSCTNSLEVLRDGARQRQQESNRPDVDRVREDLVDVHNVYIVLYEII